MAKCPRAASRVGGCLLRYVVGQGWALEEKRLLGGEASAAVALPEVAAVCCNLESCLQHLLIRIGEAIRQDVQEMEAESCLIARYPS